MCKGKPEKPALDISLQVRTLFLRHFPATSAAKGRRLAHFPVVHMSQTPQKSGFWQALSIAWELGYVIAIPIVLFGIGGRLLDKSLDTSPWLFLTGVILSIILTSVGLVWKFKKLMRTIERENPPTTPPKS